MMKHLLSATALVAVAFMACPASAQQVRSSATGYATIQDSRDDAYREGYRDGARSDGDSSDSYRHDGQRSDHGRYPGDNLVRCESIDNRRAYCGTNGARSVALMNRISDASCIKNRTWGYNGRNIWVDRGCRAEFRMRG